MSKSSNKEFTELIFFNYFPTPENGGVPPAAAPQVPSSPPPAPPVDPPRPERPERKSLTTVILVLATVLGVTLIAYGYVSNTGFTFNKSERPAVECAELPDGGVICREPANG